MNSVTKVLILVASLILVVGGCKPAVRNSNAGAVSHGSPLPTNQSFGLTQGEIENQIRNWYNTTSVEFFGQKISPTTSAELVAVKVKDTKSIDDNDVQVDSDMSFKMKTTYQAGYEHTPMCLLIGLGFENSPAKKNEIKTLETKFEFAKIDGSWRLQIPRMITAKDGLQCGARVSEMSSTSFGPPDGQLTAFECLGKDGKTIRLELASKKMVKGLIETKEFGTIKLDGNISEGSYYMTDNQISRIRKYLGW